jgi:hypothetical protein
VILKPDARVGAEFKELNIVISPLDFFVRLRSRALQLSAVSNYVSPTQGVQVHNAHSELTGVVAVCTIHNSVDEQTRAADCATKTRGATSG